MIEKKRKGKGERGGGVCRGWRWGRRDNGDKGAVVFGE